MTDSTACRYGVIGHPIAHSRSPWIHARFAEKKQQNLTYEAIESAPEDFAGTLARLKKQGYSGVNVTVPFKHEAFAAANSHTNRATLAQAANTLMWQREGRKTTLHADNTDGPGLIRDVVFNAGFVFGRLPVLLLGAGGAAAGVFSSLIAVCPALVVVANRTREKAQELIERHYHWANMHSVALAACSLDDVLSPTHYLSSLPDQFNLVINATSSSLHGQALQFPINRLTHDGMLYDMMYGPAANDFLSPARAHGRLARDGLGMLVEQAALSFALWRNTTPPRTAPVLQELRALINAESTQTAPEKA